MIQGQNVSQKSDAYFDSFQARFHVSDTMVVAMTKTDMVTDFEAAKAKFKLVSCHYGEDAEGFQMGRSMKQLISLIEEKYGKVFQDDIPGFSFYVEIPYHQEKLVYFLAAGNNGQELSAGFYFSHADMLQDPALVPLLEEIDQEFHELVLQAKLPALQ